MIRKQSRQRDRILAYIHHVREHVTAEQIYEDLNRDQKNISLATVYRNLNILDEMNEILKIAHPVYGYVYDRTCQKHYHLHCVKCGKLVDMDLPYMEEFDKNAARNTGMDIFSHSIMLEGICPSCKEHS